MATSKKTKRKPTKRPAKKKTAVKKSSAAKARLSKKKSATKKTAGKPAAKKKVAAKKAVAKKRVARRSSPGEDTGVIERRRVPARPSGQSGDLQGLSSLEDTNSESVEELLEEGNAFEAGVLKGIEDAPFADEGEVRTREVPEDDVPEEYLDKDHDRG